MSGATAELHTTGGSATGRFLIEARFKDNAPGSLTLREFEDQCRRNAESAGGQTMVMIMKGEMGKFDGKHMEERVKHLKLWNGGSVPANWVTIKKGDSGTPASMAYKPAAYKTKEYSTIIKSWI